MTAMHSTKAGHGKYHHGEVINEDDEEGGRRGGSRVDHNTNGDTGFEPET